MITGNYAVIFEGEILAGFERDSVIDNVADLFKVSREQAERMFTASKVVVKKGLSEELAGRYLDALGAAGARARLEQQQPAVAEAPVPPTPATQPARASHAGGAGEQTPPQVGDMANDGVDIREVKFEFHGNGFEYFKIWIVNLLLSVVTLGIYSAWAKVRNKQYFYGNTQLDGVSFHYTGNPVSILKGRLIAGVFFILYTAAINLVPILGAVLAVVLLVVMPWVVTRSLAFNAYNSVYRNIRFRFVGTVKQAIFPFILWPLAAGLTAGLLSPVAFYKQQRFMVENHAFGGTRFQFHAGWGDYVRMFLIAILSMVAGVAVVFFLLSGFGPVAIIVLAAVYLLVFAYFSVQSFNLRFLNTTLRDHCFDATMEVGSYAVLVLVNTLALTLTLGFFRPWAMVRVARYKAAHLSLMAEGDLDDFLAAQEMEQSAFGEGVSDLFDFEFGL